MPLIHSFTDLKIRILSSLFLLLFAFIFFISNSIVSTIFIFIAYFILLYEWHICSKKNKKMIDIIVFFFITMGCLSFAGVNFLRYFHAGEVMLYSLFLWVLLVPIFTDTGGYFFGRIFQGKRLFPNISPGKTLSGYIGGLLLGGLVPICLNLFLSPGNLTIQNAIIFIAVGIFLSLSSICGDLLQSYFKRCHNVKDSGKILPGHGGLFDRLDAILGASIATMMLILLVIFVLFGK